MNKILSVLLAMMLLCSAMFTVGVSADASPLVVTQATMDNSGNITVIGKYTSGDVAILATVQNAEGTEAALGTMANGETIVYVDQAATALDGTFKFQFQPRTVSGTHTTVYVCADGLAANLFAGNLTGNDVKVTYDGVKKTYTSNNGVVSISLRPAEKADTPVATLTGYFKQWNFMGISSDTAGTKDEVELDVKSGIITATSEYFADPAHTVISNAKAQRAVINDDGVEKNVVRFLALVSGDYEEYDNAGFVFSTLGENPTVEAGYKPHALNKLYKKIRILNGQLDVAGFTTEFTANFAPAGILYANVAVEDVNTVYYATPYIEKDGVRVYGETKAASFSALADLDGVQ